MGKMKRTMPVIACCRGVIPFIFVCLVISLLITLTYLVDELTFVLMPFKAYFPALFKLGCLLLCTIPFILVTVCYMGWAVLMQNRVHLQKGGWIMSMHLFLITTAAISIQYSMDYEHSEALLKKVLDEYEQNGNITLLDRIQYDLDCCGVWSFYDYNANEKDDYKPGTPFFRNWKCTLPSSCLKDIALTPYQLKWKDEPLIPMFQLMDMYTFEASDRDYRTAFFWHFPTDIIHATDCQWRLLTMWSIAKSQMFVLTLMLAFVGVTCKLIEFCMLWMWKDEMKIRPVLIKRVDSVC